MPDFQADSAKDRACPKTNAIPERSKCIDLKNAPVFLFGYGLSCTSFAYSQLGLSSKTLKECGNLLVNATVKTTGDRFGEEIVQLYVHDVVASVTRLLKELRGFEQIALNPGESEQVQFTLTAGQLKFCDRDKKWTIEPETFSVYIRVDSAEGLESRFEYQSK